MKQELWEKLIAGMVEPETQSIDVKLNMNFIARDCLIAGSIKFKTRTICRIEKLEVMGISDRFFK